MASHLSLLAFAVCLVAASLPAFLATPAPTDLTTPRPTPTILPSTTSEPLDLLCRPDCQAGVADSLVPNMCRCQGYYQCSKTGALTPALCKPWENFDSKTSTCVFWWDADCSAVLPPATLPPPVVPGCTWAPKCPATGTQNLGIACKDSCKQYLACKDGAWTMEDCPIWQPKFDTKENRCVMWGAQCAGE